MNEPVSFPRLTEDGEVPPISREQMHYIRQHGTPNPFYARAMASKAAGYVIVNGEKVAWDEMERRALANALIEPKLETDATETVCVELDPDVAEVFPTAEAVNTALRRIIQTGKMLPEPV